MIEIPLTLSEYNALPTRGVNLLKDSPAQIRAEITAEWRQTHRENNLHANAALYRLCGGEPTISYLKA